MGKKNKLYQIFVQKTNPMLWGFLGSLAGIILMGIHTYKATHSIWRTMLGCFGGIYIGMFGVAILYLIVYMFIFWLPRRLGYNVDGDIRDADYGKKIK